jgi:hypothetical protein
MELPAVNSTPLHPVMVGSSRTAGQETVVVVVLSVVVLSVVFEPSSLLQEMTERLKHKIRKMNKTFFIFLSI